EEIGLVVGQVGLGGVVLRRPDRPGADVPRRQVVLLTARPEDVTLAAGDAVDDADAVPVTGPADLARDAGDDAGRHAVRDAGRVGVGEAVLHPVGHTAGEVGRAARDRAAA